MAESNFEPTEIETISETGRVTLIFRSESGESREVVVPRDLIPWLFTRLAGDFGLSHSPPKDVVDAEFRDIDEDHPPREHPAPAPIPTRQRVPWFNLLIVAAVAVAIYGIFFRGDHASKTDAPPPAGWLDLLGCTYTRSLDGTKFLSLGDDNGVELQEPAPPDKSGISKNLRTNGQWTYDEATKKYVVTVKGETTAYSLLNQDDIATCVLVKGAMTAADLSGSWFSTLGDNDEGNTDPEPIRGD